MSGQLSIIYEVDDGIREVTRSRSGGFTPGDVIQRESTQSDPETGLPELDVPGRGELGKWCGEDMPAFACEDCGNPVYIGNTCYSPRCSRCWAGAVKRTTIKAAAKIEDDRYNLFYDQPGDEDVRTHQVVASPPPSILYDTENPIERSLSVIQALLPQFMAEPDNRSFFAAFHPWRIKQEYRKDVYDHGGEQGQGDMRWSDVLSKDDWKQYVKFEPHFHIFCNTRYFDKTVSERIEDRSGWVFHRIEDGSTLEPVVPEERTTQSLSEQ